MSERSKRIFLIICIAVPFFLYCFYYYSQMFKNTPELHCKLVNRMVQGNTVIDQESVTGWGDKPATAIAIYTIEKGKIARVSFVQ